LGERVATNDTKTYRVAEIKIQRHVMRACLQSVSQLVAIDVLQEVQVGKEKLFIHPKLMQLLTRDSNDFKPYA